MRTVFISYSSDDLTQVKSVEAQLKSSGDIQVWCDQERLYGGEKWPKILGEAIAQQDLFLLFWSRQAAVSRFVEFEWTTALALKKTIIPCQLDDEPLPNSLAAIHALQARDIENILKHIQCTNTSSDTVHSEAVLSKLAQIKTTEIKEAIEEFKNFLNFNLCGANVNNSTVNVFINSTASINSGKTADSPNTEARYLIGRVVSIGEYDELTPEIGLEISIMQSNERAQTDKNGRFQLPLNENLTSGTEISLSLDKADWRIYTPMDGKVRVPAELDKALIEVQLLPRGSKKFWSHDRIEKFIQDIAEKAKQQVQPQGKPQDIDLSRYIKEWALTYGFSVQQAKTEIDKWATEVEQQNDPYQLGLAAFARKNFGEASQFFAQSAQQKAQAYQQALVEAEQYRADMVRDYRLAGNAAYSNYQFAASRSHYEDALRHIDKAQQPQLWGVVQNEIGIVIYELAIRTEGNDIHTLFKQAVQAYREALTVQTREALPQDWAATQNNLGNVLSNQGIRTQGETGTQLLKQAAQAYREALEVDSGNEQSYQAAAALYYDVLFAFHDALTVHQQWLQRHSDDLSARANFAEAHFTTGRFAEAEQQLAALMTHTDLEPGTRVGLQGIRIANWLALHEIAQARVIGEELLALLDKLPADFEPGWGFTGTRYYVNQEPQLAAQREVLLDLLTALEEKDAVQRRRVLESVMERIKAMQSNLH